MTAAKTAPPAPEVARRRRAPGPPVRSLPPKSLRAFLTPMALRVAWDAVGPRASAGVDGVDGRCFQANLDRYLQLLAEWIGCRSWRPDPLRWIYVPKPSGGYRTLGIPTLRDRVLQRSILAALTPRAELLLHDHVHGFRPGRSPRTAAACLARQLSEGAPGDLVRTDIHELFDHLDHRQVLRTAAVCWTDPDWLRLLRGFLADWYGPRGPGYGVPQGAPLSPLLANLVLARALDGPLAALAEATIRGCGNGHPDIELKAWARYADDLLLACPAKGQGRALLAWAQGTLRASGLFLSSRKTLVVAPREGAVLPWLGGLLVRERGSVRWKKVRTRRS